MGDTVINFSFQELPLATARSHSADSLATVSSDKNEHPWLSCFPLGHCYLPSLSRPGQYPGDERT